MFREFLIVFLSRFIKQFQIKRDDDFFQRIVKQFPVLIVNSSNEVMRNRIKIAARIML